MIILLLFAFAAGLVNILSPCILPVLPIVLSGGTGKGRYRPIGIALGLLLSFTILTLTLTEIVNATHLPPIILRNGALILLSVFGLILLFPRLDDWVGRITYALTHFGHRLHKKKQKPGLTGGLVLGIALGLIWTPCSGPILGAVASLVATHKIDLITFLMTFAFGLGICVPIFLIAYGENRLLVSFKYSKRVRQGFGILMLLGVAAFFTNFNVKIQQLTFHYFPSLSIENNRALLHELEKLQKQAPPTQLQTQELPQISPAPEFIGITKWINSPPLTLQKLRGHVVLLQFWSYDCIFCIEALEYVKKWYEIYHKNGLVVIGIHTPQYPIEADSAKVEAAIQSLDIRYPIAIDNNHETWNAYHNQYWPSLFLIDQQGMIRFIHFGAGDYAAIESGISSLMHE